VNANRSAKNAVLDFDRRDFQRNDSAFYSN
jgi:hypothetical protein